MPRKDAPTGPISAQAQQDLVSDGIENFELPKSLVTKIAKSALPDNTKLQKETVLSLVKGSTVFINYLAATAHDVAISKQHKSISASDVLKALETIEFGDLVQRLSDELVVYRNNAKLDKNSKFKVPLNPPSTAQYEISPSSLHPNASSSSSHNPASASAPAPAPKPKGKGKEPTTAAGKGKDKEMGAPLPPFTSAPLVSRQEKMAMEVDWEEELGEAASASVSAAASRLASVFPSASASGAGISVGPSASISRATTDVEDEGEGEGEGFDEDEDEQGREDEDEVDEEVVDDDDDDDDEGGEEPEDPMEVEEVELKRDARGLEGMELDAQGGEGVNGTNGHLEA